jgi:flagellar hook-associated protein 1 FlgK
MLGAAYQIGRSALTAYQAAVSITGQNIANLGNPDYARQTGRLASIHGGMTPAGVAPGMGVNVASLRRNIDNAVEERLRMALAARSSADVTYQTLNEVEALYHELTDYDLSTELSDFFGSFGNLQTDPLEVTNRDLILSHANNVIATLQRQRTGILTQAEHLNVRVDALVTEANGLAGEIAQLNELVVTSEAVGQGNSNGLRDRRDALLRQLGEIVQIQTREQDTGVVNVYVGSEPLVDFAHSRGLTTERVIEGGFERLDVVFADNGSAVDVRDGSLAGVVTARDTHLATQLERLDTLAQGMIYEVNRQHTQGAGLIGYTSILSSYRVDASDAALNSSVAGLTYPVQNGSFVVRVKSEASGQVSTRMIEVDLDGLNGDDTSLDDLAAALNAVAGLSSQVTADNRLQITTDDGYEVTFGDDTSGALAALGVANFFEGEDALTIAVKRAITDDPRLIAASRSGAPGDGSNAGAMGSVLQQVSTLLGNKSVQDYHAAITTDLAVTVSAAESRYEASDAVYSNLLAQRESLSGVNLDEEAINLTKYERSFQGASRYLSVLDALASEVLALVS